MLQNLETWLLPEHLRPRPGEALHPDLLPTRALMVLSLCPLLLVVPMVAVRALVAGPRATDLLPVGVALASIGIPLLVKALGDHRWPAFLFVGAGSLTIHADIWLEGAYPHPAAIWVPVALVAALLLNRGWRMWVLILVNLLGVVFVGALGVTGLVPDAAPVHPMEFLASYLAASLAFIVFAALWARERIRQLRASRETADALNDLIEELSAKTAQAESANLAKDEFLAVMSHEVRTPLNGVIGTAELLTEQDLSAEARELAETLQSSSLHLRRILDDVLDYAKIRAGKLDLVPGVFEVRPWMRGILDTHRYGAQGRGLELVGEVNDDVPDCIIADDMRLRQVVDNLINNAIKFTAAGQVRVRVVWVPGEAEHGTLRISVEDTGIGMTEAEVARVFDRFTQATSSTSRSYGGTGLGLSIAAAIVERMEGRVDVESTPGQGSTFRVSVPVELGEPSSVTDEISTAPELYGTRALVVDDHPVNRMVAARMLERIGCDVALAGGGEQAVTMVRDGAFDVVFMDCEMPEVDGFEATRRIRALGHSFGELPIIALTAHVLPEHRARGQEVGMTGWLSKPTTGQALTRAIREACLEETTAVRRRARSQP